MWEAPTVPELQAALDDPSNPIGMRMRAAYHLRHVHEKANEEEVQKLVVETLSKGLLESRHGSLMRHEFAYVMGQLRDERVRPMLLKSSASVLVESITNLPLVYYHSAAKR